MASFNLIKPEPIIELPKLKGLTVEQARQTAIVREGMRYGVMAIQARLSLPAWEGQNQDVALLMKGLKLGADAAIAKLAPKVPAQRPGKKMRNRPEPAPPERRWTVPELQFEKKWTNTRIHECFDFDPECERKGDPNPHWDLVKGRMVRGYVTILSIPDHCVAREEARAQGVMKKPKRV